MPEQPSLEIIQHLFDAFKRPGAEQGGIARLAELLRSPPSTVSSWTRIGVPQWRKHAILRIAYAHRVILPGEVIDYLDPAHDIAPPKGYPIEPGYQKTDTSKAAASKISPLAPMLRQQVLDAIEAAGDNGLTADEIAKKLKLAVTSTRPRTTELKLKGKIKDSGTRRKNAGGCSSIVWVLT
jgi:hypothetical protein